MFFFVKVKMNLINWFVFNICMGFYDFLEYYSVYVDIFIINYLKVQKIEFCVFNVLLIINVYIIVLILCMV